ncbi:LOW QUALITY PROTEIN: short coiled-coil protein-like [Pan paniscus]|uniref:LOW QUALITY PROTEIN: short coiled-coil protein-like n=1 Tax=Pan paniscus TaxID=9597 RepID=UPI0030058750
MIISITLSFLFIINKLLMRYFWYHLQNSVLESTVVSWSKCPGLRHLPKPSHSWPLKLEEHSSCILCPRLKSLLPKMMSADMDAVDAENQVELEENTRLINQVWKFQLILEDLSARANTGKEENLKLKSENQVVGQHIENLMSASGVFQTTDTESKRK